jgi:hypothetical protein
LLLLVAAVLPPADHGRTQLVWQDAACALQVIMQLVTVDVCASRILPAKASLAKAAPPNPATLKTGIKARTAHKIAKRRMIASPPLARRHHNAIRPGGKCRTGLYCADLRRSATAYADKM